MPFLPHKGFTLTGRLKTAKCECLWSRANCQEWIFLKQPNRRLQQLLAVENKKILQQLKPSAFYIMFHLTLIFIHITLACVHKCFTLTDHLKSPRANVCEAASNRWLKYLLEVLTCCRKIFMLKQKSSNLYIIGFKSVRKFLSDCLSTLHYKPLPMKCNVTRQSATWLQQADLISALCETCAWLQAKLPWLQAKYTMVAFKCSPDHTVRQQTL